MVATGYDANSRLIRLIDDNGGATMWTYDTLDRQTIMTFHDGSTRTNTYDAASDITGYVDENGSEFTNTFDVLGRKTNVSITPATGVYGTTSQAFQFDGLSRMTFARDTTPSNGDVDVAFTFDSLSRLLEESQTVAGDTQYVTHDAFVSFAATDLTYPNNRRVGSGFDVLYRRNAATEGPGGASIAQWQFFGSRIATTTLGNGITCSFMNNAQTASAEVVP